VRDLLNGTTERVNLGDMGQEGNSSTTLASISANGRWVVFNSFANNLVPDDTNDQFDTFIHDRQTGLTERVNVSSDEEQANGLSSNPSVNDDGRLVVFWSDATNLVPNDTNDRRDIFVRDRVAGTTERVSVSSDEEQADGSSPEAGVRGFIASNPQITPDGRYVAFFSSAKNLVPGDTNSCPPNFQEPGRCPDVFIRDRVAGTTTRVNVSASGAQANDRSSDPAITPSGQAVAFFSAAGNLVTGDNNPCPPIFPVNCADIFYHEAAATTAVPAAAQSPGVPLTVTAQPNPATAGADLAIAGTDPAAMSIVIYDVAGRVVRTLASGVPGTSTVSWNGADDRGRRVKAGVYIGRIEQGDRVAVEKIILLPD
jgi:Tol biopolymer transport system component